MKPEKWTPHDIPDLSGRVIIVTGANTGIGYQAANLFLKHGAETILACRNGAKAGAAIKTIRRKLPGAKARYLELDLGKLESVARFAEEFKNLYSRLDVLVNNAGIILHPYSLTDDGFESHIGINYLGHFALTGQLMGVIQKTEGARIVNVSSRVYKKGTMDFENFMFSNGQGFTRLAAYGRSKLAQLLFTYELDRRFQLANLDAKALAAHPGYTFTDFGRRTAAAILKYSFYPLVRIVTQLPSRGALPTVRAAVDPGLKGADFYGPSGRFEIKGYPAKVQSNGASQNREDAAKLWAVSEELTGIQFCS